MIIELKKITTTNSEEYTLAIGNLRGQYYWKLRELNPFTKQLEVVKASNGFTTFGGAEHDYKNWVKLHLSEFWDETPITENT